jgi:hypothetical protein
MVIEESDVQRFAQLFQGNKRSFGQYMPKAHKPSFTVNEEYTIEHIRSHLEGHVGVGLGPITDDNKSLWGPNAQNVDIEAVDLKIQRDKLPLVAARTKSGGVHCYVFFRSWEDPSRVRLLLTRWANGLGFPTAEIFPKQSTLDTSPTAIERPKASWLNLPYYNALETERWAIDGGKQVTFDYFLSLAEGKRVDIHEYEHGADVDYASGPPCLQEMLKNRIETGGRNTAVFQAAVFLKRAFSSDWKSRLVEFNAMALVTPLPQNELRTIMGSVHKRDYQYKCREEPCRTFCNRDACKKREHGITDKDAAANDVPLIDKVEKVIATPIRWDLTIKGRVVSVSTGELFNYESVRQKVGEVLHIVLPRLKNQEWDLFLQEIMGKVEIKEEMTIEGIMLLRVCEFVRRANTDRSKGEDERRDDLRRGMPAFICIARTTFNAKNELEHTAGKWFYAFKMMDFIEWMKRKKALPCQEYQVHTILTKVFGEGAKRTKMRIGEGQVSNVWCVSEEVVEDERVPEKVFSSEF